MKIQRDVVWSYIDDWNEKEQEVLRGYFDNFEDESSLLHGVNSGSSTSKFYSGLVPWLRKNNVDIEIGKDYANGSVAVQDVDVCSLIFDGFRLRDYQVTAVRKALCHGRGIIQSPTGSGKSLMSAAVYAHLNLYHTINRLIYLTPTVFIAEQTVLKLKEYGFDSVCLVGGGQKYEPGFEIYVFVVDSAYRGLSKPDVAECIRTADMLVLDEAHHASAKSWMHVSEYCEATYRFAYTATVHDDPGKYSYVDLVLIGLIGPIIFEVRSKELRDRGYLADPIVTVLKTNSPKFHVYHWREVYEAGIVENRKRNSMIVDIASSCFEGNNKVMVFVSRKKHGHLLADRIREKTGSEVCFVHGNRTVYMYRSSGVVNKYRWRVKKIVDYLNERDRVVLITTTVLDEGLDVPVINVLIMGTAMKKYRRTVQRAGRGMRPKEGHNKVFIFDFYDNNHPYLEKHSKYRLWTYQTELFDIAESLKETVQILGNPIHLTMDTRS